MKDMIHVTHGHEPTTRIKVWSNDFSLKEILVLYEKVRRFKY